MHVRTREYKKAPNAVNRCGIGALETQKAEKQASDPR